MRRLCTETSRSYLGRSVGRSDAEMNRESRTGGTGTLRPRRCGELPAASERTGNERESGIARREGILVVTWQKSAAAIVVAARLTRTMQRRAKHEEKGGAVTDSIWTLNPTGGVADGVVSCCQPFAFAHGHTWAAYKPLDEPPTADPHGGWCGEGRLETGPYPISTHRLAVLRALVHLLRPRQTP